MFAIRPARDPKVEVVVQLERSLVSFGMLGTAPQLAADGPCLTSLGLDTQLETERL